MNNHWLMGLIMATLFAPMTASAQASSLPDLEDIGYGLYLKGNVAMHRPDFAELDGIPSCCNKNYTASTMPGMQAGVFYRQALSGKVIGEVRLGWRGTNATFIQSLNIPTAGEVDSMGIPELIDLGINYSLTSFLSTFDIEILMGYRLLNAVWIYTGLTGSLRLGTEADYREYISPKHGVSYVAKDRSSNKYERNFYTGPIPSASAFPLTFSLGAGYSIPLDRREHIFLEPQIFYSHGLNSIIDQEDGSWHVHSLNFGVAIRYTPLGIPPLPSPTTSTTPDDPPPLPLD